MKLYEINNGIREVIENGFYVDEETGEYFDAESLEQLQANLADKREAVAVVIKELTAENEAVANEIKNLQERKKQGERHIEWLKGYLATSLEATGEKSFETSKCKVSTRRTESVEVYEQDQLEERFLTEKITYTPNKTAIKEAIKAGENVFGAELKTNTSVTIK